MPPKSKSDPSNDILQVLKEKNRPFSVITLTDELKGEYGQAAVKKAVEKLASEKKCTEKVSGKAKLYFANQDELRVASQDELDKMDNEIESLRENFATLKEKLDSLKARKAQLSSMMPFDQLVEYRKQIEEQVQVEEDKKNELIKLSEGITPEDAEKSQKEFDVRCSQWKSRRAKCMEIIDQLSEGCGKKPSELIKDMEIETDDSVGLKLEFKNKKYTIYEDTM
ncbi:PSMC3 interacting protein [Tritrichomonas musculus]|uniref:Homologous-pairing protein 2 homolog n=1 Tax=Tritrichomonas musculus TaxID=1915356 RepID=A0ABR2JPF7_9EUKA